MFAHRVYRTFGDILKWFVRYVISVRLFQHLVQFRLQRVQQKRFDIHASIRSNK